MQAAEPLRVAAGVLGYNGGLTGGGVGLGHPTGMESGLPRVRHIRIMLRQGEITCTRKWLICNQFEAMPLDGSVG